MLIGELIVSRAAARQAGLNEDEREHDERKKQHVSNREDLRVRVVKEQLMEPVADEVPFVALTDAGLVEQRILPRREGANLAEKTLGGDKCYQQQMRDAEAKVPHEVPLPKAADPNDWQ